MVNILVREGAFDGDLNLECEGTYNYFNSKHASDGSEIESTSVSYTFVSDMAGWASVSVKELDRVHFQGITEGSSVRFHF